MISGFAGIHEGISPYCNKCQKPADSFLSDQRGDVLFIRADCHGKSHEKAFSRLELALTKIPVANLFGFFEGPTQ